MLETILKVILILSFCFIFYQDLKNRAVYWFLFPLVGGCTGFLFFFQTVPELFLVSVLFNTIYVSILIGVIFIYTKLKLKKRFSDVIGLGDILLLTAIIFACNMVSFIIMLPCALIFSLAMHLFLSKHQNNKTVPLAGYMSLFYGLAFLGFWFGAINSLYQL